VVQVREMTVRLVELDYRGSHGGASVDSLD
jgi:hypothetical protein